MSRKHLLKHIFFGKRRKISKMKNEDIQYLDVILNNLNTYISKLNSPVSSELIALRSRLERLVGTQFRRPQIFNVTVQEASDTTYILGFQLAKMHITNSGEIAEVWSIIQRLFERPKSPSIIDLGSSTSPSTISSLSNLSDDDAEYERVDETATMFKDVVSPYLHKHKGSLQWVYDILDHKKDFQRIAFEDPCTDIGFILLPDLQWDGKTIETLYLLALVHNRDIKSLRDLTADNLPLLRNIRDKGCGAIRRIYGVNRSKLRISLHYQPSFYHLHVRFTYLIRKEPEMDCDRLHGLDTVINNIELLSDYYQRATLSYQLRKTDFLYEKLNESGPSKKLKADEPSTSLQGTL